MKVGSGQREPEWVNEVLCCKTEEWPLKTAPASGLYLTEVTYPEPYFFPRSPALFLI